MICVIFIYGRMIFINKGTIQSAIIRKQRAKERIDEYNQNPNLCLCCKSPILAPYDKKLNETKIKKFCSKSCAAKYNNLGRSNNKMGKGFVEHPIIDNFSDDEIINIFNQSKNIKDFSKRLGFSSKISYKNIYTINRLESLGLSLDDLKNKNESLVMNLTKCELFKRYKSWQTARSYIQKFARNIYVNSSKPKQCVICGYDKHYEVAHIKAVSDFNDSTLISEINNIDNLIALCPNHHWEYDNNGLDIKPFL